MSIREGSILIVIRNVREQCFTWYRAISDMTKAPPLIGPQALAPTTISISWSHCKLQAFLASSLARWAVPAHLLSVDKPRMRVSAFWRFDLFCTEIDNSMVGPLWTAGSWILLSMAHSFLPERECLLRLLCCQQCCYADGCGRAL